MVFVLSWISIHRTNTIRNLSRDEEEEGPGERGEPHHVEPELSDQEQSQKKNTF